jgi:cell division initiation protein
MSADDNIATLDARRSVSSDRQFSVTPLDMRQTRFASALGGYNKAEVRNFLVEASQGYDVAVRENERLRQEIARLDGALKQYRTLEQSLNATLVNAQRSADDLRNSATQEATRLVREAEGRAELMLLSAQARVEDSQREVDALRLRRREAEGSLESLITALHSTLEFVREPQREPRLLPHRPRMEAAS